MKKLLVTVTLAACAAAASAYDVRFKNIYQSHMVLQAGKANEVAGRSDPGASVSVTGEATRPGAAAEKIALRAKADKTGRWTVTLPALPRRTVLKLTCSDGKTSKTIDDVVFGELWLCSGQSNMEWNFNANTIPADYLKACRESVPAFKGDIRTIVTERNCLVSECDEIGGTWNRIDEPDHLRRAGSQFGYLFAQLISKALDTPVGIIDSSVGGSRIEPWIPEFAFKESNVPFHTQDHRPYRWDGYRAAIGTFAEDRAAFIARRSQWLSDNPSNDLRNRNRDTMPQPPLDVLGQDHLPAKFFNGKICGLAPLKPAGVLWYQGCSNESEPYEYGELAKLLVTSWRRHFKTDFPFYYVELAAINEPQREPVQKWSWGGIREAQAEVLALPKTGVITSADAGGSRALGEGDIHPPCKRMIAGRAAKLVLAEVYGKGDPVAARSPYYAGVSKAEGGKFRVKIANADGLRLMAGKEKIDGFAIRGEKRDAWKWADARIEGDEIVLSSPEVPNPVAVRYGWARRPRLTLESAHALPLRPFSTDHGSTLDYGK